MTDRENPSPSSGESREMRRCGQARSYVCACPDWENKRGEHLWALVDHTMLPRILQRLLNEHEFMSAYGVRSVSRIHAEQRDLGVLPGIGRALIEYVPGVWRPASLRLGSGIEETFP
jgi:hypothetical protein